MQFDTDEVYMTTELKGNKTFFLPFNKGNNRGKGNPVVEGKEKTSYLWEDILSKDSLLDIVKRFYLYKKMIREIKELYFQDFIN